MILETKIEKKESGVLQVDCKIDAKHIEKSMNQALNEVHKKAKIKGFREGKAPIAMIKKLYGGDVKYQALNQILPQAYEQIVKDNNLKPITMPEFSGYDQMEEGQDLNLSFTIEVAPAIEKMADIKEAEGKKIEFEYNLEEILEKELKILQETYANYEEINDAIQEDDFVKASYRLLNEKNEEIAKKTNFFMVKEKDSQYVISKNFLGKNLKETHKTSVQFPEDYLDKTLAGTEQTLEFTLEEGKRVIYPALNDEFAKKFQLENLDQVKEVIKKGFTLKTQEKSLLSTADKIYEDLAQKSEFSISNSIVLEQSQADLSQKINQMMMQGKSIDAYLKEKNLDQQGFIEEAKQESFMNIKKYLIMDRIANEEKIEVAEQEIYDKIKEIKESEVANKDQVEEHYKKNQKAKDALKERIKAVKVAQWVVDNVKITGTEKKKLGE